MGLGTGGYGTTHNSYNAYPECWMEIAGWCGPPAPAKPSARARAHPNSAAELTPTQPPHPQPSSGNYTIAAVDAWLNAGGRRLDAADSYDTQYSVGAAMARSAVPRSDIFVLQKTCVGGQHLLFGRARALGRAPHPVSGQTSSLSRARALRRARPVSG